MKAYFTLRILLASILPIFNLSIKIETFQSETHQYAIYDDLRSFSGQQAFCREQLDFTRGTLVKPESNEEALLLLSKNESMDNFYVDYRRAFDNNGRLPSSYGLPPNFGQERGIFPWLSGRPDDLPEEHCVKGSTKKGGWDESKCTIRRKIPCQRDRIRLQSQVLDETSQFTVIASDDLSFDLAKESCASLSPPGIPAVFRNIEEYDSVIRLIEDVDILGSGPNFFWTGLVREIRPGVSGPFVFIDGTDNVFPDLFNVPWTVGGPSIRNSEQCVRIEREEGVNLNLLNDISCNERGGVVCRQSLVSALRFQVEDNNLKFTAAGTPVLGTFEKAVELCQDMSPPGLPASFRTPEEFEILRGLISDLEEEFSNEDLATFYWIGLRRQGEDSETTASAFNFIDGTRNTIALTDSEFPWDFDQPDNLRNVGEECAIIDSGIIRNELLLHDASCDNIATQFFGGTLCIQDISQLSAEEEAKPVTGLILVIILLLLVTSLLVYKQGILEDLIIRQQELTLEGFESYTFA